MKRFAVLTASAFRGKFRNRPQNKHFFTLAFAFLLCGVFYWLNFPEIQKFSIVQAKNKEIAKKSADICEKPLPQASLSDPSFELYKIEVLCEKPQEKNLEIPEEPEDPEVEKLKKELETILEDTPMEKMIDPISKQEKTVAAFLVGIAFKESKFGVYSPTDHNGNHCFNYWGFKGKTNPQKSGYSCFSSPEEAVEKVGKRLEKLVLKNKLNTPAKMTVWKCGSSCATHTPGSVSKWISDVSVHFYPLAKS